ncbi:MAG: leucine--tRNA ligase [Patescibacteria group bacterium]|nr:leucine--tRNA ligase [Patescibacteria group bacterium]
MASIYPFQEIEKKWQEHWDKEGTYRAEDLPAAEKSKKFYGLIEFPYPSGEGLHVGHPRSYIAIDLMTRKKRMEGKDVLYPIGWDAFGLPTENFAIKHKIRPADATAKNVANFTRQIKSLGIGFDWSREINTTDPEYYKWTQWMFLKFYGSYFDAVEGRAKPIDLLAIPQSVAEQGEEATKRFRDEKRMAFKTATKINWCPSCKIGLANEEAIGGVCERCGTTVEQRTKEQWMIRITAYAQRLLDDLVGVDYLEKIKAQQINWIGRSEGAYVDFDVTAGSGLLPDKLAVFTTRPDTLFGATYMVLAPEHEMVARWIEGGLIENVTEVETYKTQARGMSELQRQENKEKTGVALKGLMAINPANNEKIPVWIADYVLAGYGTGAIMAVPAHDERDFEFAQKFGLPIVQVVAAAEGDETRGLPFTSLGVAFNSGILNGLATDEAKAKMIEWLAQNGCGRGAITYKLRDWVFSRQRYWGEPIPLVKCQKCGWVPIPEDQLPVTLPDVEKYEPSDTGESPLAAIRDWVETTCPQCGGSAERETDTMPNWAGSSWYFMRYCDPHNDKAFADPEKLKFWMPVDLYNGGMEHTTLHLLYSRFWYKFMWDLGLVPHECSSEPYAKRRSHALILGEGGIKMSKSKGNVVNPDDVVKEYGADVFRVYQMFIGPFDQDAPWDTHGIEGVKRFLEKIFVSYDSAIEKNYFISPEKTDEDLVVLYNQTVKKVSNDIEGMKFNTAVSALMILSNKAFEKFGTTADFMPKEMSEGFLKIFAPFAPHLSDELWHKLGHTTSIHREPWPQYDPAKCMSATFEMVVQVNGKVRDKMEVSADISEEEAKAIALASEKVQAFLVGKEPQKIVYVKGRLVSISV